MFGLSSMNGSVQRLGVPAPLRTDGPPWTDNILVSSPAWVTGGNVTNPNWGIQPGGPYGIVVVPWSVTVRALTAYALSSLENMRSVAFHVHNDLLRYNRTARMQILSTSRSVLHNCLINRQDCDWDDLWDEPVDQ